MAIDYANLTPEQMWDMSPEDFAKLKPQKFDNEAPATEPEPTTVEEQVPPEVEETPTTPPEEEIQPTEEAELEPTPDASETTSSTVPNGTVSEAEQAQAGTQEKMEGEEAQTTTPEPTVEVSPEKAFFDKVTGGFQANGKEYKIDSAEDAVQLMQMGLNYHKKMADMKPGMKVLKALQDQGIESVEQLGYLLDLHNKKPEAIAKLIQESGIDAFDLNEEKAQAYQPSVPQVSDAVINFEEVARSLEGNPHFGTVVNQLKTYDEHTKQEIFNNPHLLNLLTAHVANGQYDTIMTRLSYEQSLGRMQGMSFLQAYDKVGEALFGTPQPNNVQTPVVTAAPVATPVATPVASKPKPSNNAARQAAAAPASTAAQVSKQVLTPDDIWNMPLEDFKKLNPKFL